MSEVDKQYRELLYKGFLYSTEQFDKAILFVSSGSLAISITLIEKVVPLATSKYSWLLLFSWLFQALTIILFTLNHYVSIQAFNREMKQDGAQNGKENKLVKHINKFSIVTLLFGLLLLITFIFINIHHD